MQLTIFIYSIYYLAQTLGFLRKLMINQSFWFFKILIIITTQLTYASYRLHNVSTNCTTASLDCPTQEPVPLPVAPCRYRTTTTAGIRNLVTRKRRPERSADLTEWLTVGGKIWIQEEFVFLLKMTLRTQFISYTEC